MNFVTVLASTILKKGEDSVGVMETISLKSQNIVFFKIDWLNKLVGIDIPFVLYLLGGSSLFLTVYLGFINVKGFRRAIRTVKGKYSTPEDPGEITHFQALCSALSATVGLGNIAGVAIAITAGGPGAAFWMIICGFLGMTTKFCECTLGTKYRDIDKNGKVNGGAMLYLQKGFKEVGFKSTGKVLAIIFAIACVLASFGAGNMFQGNQAFEQVLAVSGGENSIFFNRGWIFGVVIACVVGSIIMGGVKSVGKVTEKLVPIMCLIYILAASYVIIAHIDKVGWALSLIVSEAFNLKSAVVGGFTAVIVQGLKRAAFSNEAGFGSAPIVQSAVKTKRPASEGYVSLLEPFVDTVIVCTMTALVIILTGVKTTSGDWVQAVGITSQAFGSVITWFPYVLFAAVLLFAVSTMISWSYYGEQAWLYLFGKKKSTLIIYKAMFCCFIIVGCSTKLEHVLDFSDAMFFLMCFPNFIGIFVLLPKIKKELKEFDVYASSVDEKE